MNMMRVGKALLYHVSLLIYWQEVMLCSVSMFPVYLKDSLLLFLDYLIVLVSKRQNVA